MAAALEIKVRLDPRGLRAAERMLRGIPNGLRRVVPPAINRTLTRTRTFADGVLQKEVPVKKSAIRRHTTVFKASRYRFVGSLRYNDHRFAIASFKGVRPTKKGVTYAGPEGRKLIPRAFITKGFTHYKTQQYVENKMVWRRATAGRLPGGRDLVPRTPLTAPKGVSLGYAWTKHPEIRAAVERFGRRLLVREIHTKIYWIARKYA